jgi:hypothetical protein
VTCNVDVLCSDTIEVDGVRLTRTSDSAFGGTRRAIVYSSPDIVLRFLVWQELLGSSEHSTETTVEVEVPKFYDVSMMTGEQRLSVYGRREFVHAFTAKNPEYALRFLSQSMADSRWRARR